jgi:threonine-phosphate decarboxylase
LLGIVGLGMAKILRQIHGGDIYSLARRLGCPEDQITDFSASINPLGVSPRALTAITECLDKLDHYPDPQAIRLKEQLSAHYRLPSESLLMGNGSTELIYLLPRALKPKKVLIVSPTFSEYEKACQLMGAKIRDVRLQAQDGFRVSLDSIDRQYRKGIDMLFLCNPNNPTGQHLYREEILWLVKQAARGSTLVIVDEAFMDYLPDQSLLSLPGHGAMAHSNLVVLRSFTKFYALSGLRIGYLVAKPDLIRRLGARQEPWSVNTLAQIAARESLLDETYIKESLRFMEVERPQFISELSSIPGIRTFHTQANFVLMQVANPRLSAQDLYESLALQGLLLRSCKSFKGLGSGYLRAAIKRQDENNCLCQAMRRLLSPSG